MFFISCDVAIIGAGLAGLTAAERLKSNGYQVKIIEAQSRVGGRVFTHHESNEIHFELGAFSFGNAEPLLWEYINRFALPVIQQTSINKAFWFKNYKGLMSDKATFLSPEEQTIPLDELMNYFRPQLNKITEDISFNEALQSVGASEEAIEWLQANTLAGLLGNNFHEISLKTMLSYLEEWDSSTQFYAIQGGNDLLPKTLADQLSADILFECPVREVEQKKETCILHGETFTIDARRVIFTMPLYEMNQIKITPPLSKTKQEAIANTFYTSHARISIVAPPNALGTEPRGGVFLYSDQLGWFRDQTAFQIDPNRATVLDISVAGDLAQKLTSTPEAIERWKQSIHEALQRIYPNWNPAKTTTHFSNEGKYSYFGPKVGSQQQVLQEAEDRFHFTGEHTSKKISSMVGAIESGFRVADEIYPFQFNGTQKGLIQII